MSRSESTPNTHIHPVETRVIEYAGLMDTVQLSSARLLDIQGSLAAESFKDLLAEHDPSDHERIINEVGAKFDDGLISFVTASIISRRYQDVIIHTGENEGFDGYLPWEDRLIEHIELLKSRGLLEGVQVRVERDPAQHDEIAHLTEIASKLAA